jgi:hypothetical protein
MNKVLIPSSEKNFRLSIFVLILILFAYTLPYIIHTRLPGDDHDARIALFVLETFYKGLLSGQNIIDGAFAPWPKTILLSEPLWGSAPLYSLIRFAGGSDLLSYKLWFFIGNALNIFVSFYVLKKLQLRNIPAIIGAVIFSISLPATAQDGHSALLYRFIVPLAFGYCYQVQASRKANIIILLDLAILVSIQFLLSLYIGFFLAIALLPFIFKIIFLKNRSNFFDRNFFELFKKLLLFILVFSLFYFPTYNSQQLYSSIANIEELHGFTPKLKAFFFSGRTMLYRFSDLVHFSSESLAWEKEMFLGLLTTIFLIFGGFFKKIRDNKLVNIQYITLLYLIFIFIAFFKHSLYGQIAEKVNMFLPRAPARFILVALFPIAIIVSVSIEKFQSYIADLKVKNIFAIFCLCFILCDYLFIVRGVSSEIDWNHRLSELKKYITKEQEDSISFDSVLVYASKNKGWENNKDQITAMLVAQSYSIRSMNGISSIFPHFWGAPNNCFDLFQNHIEYNRFALRRNYPLFTNENNYLLVNFDNCFLDEDKLISGVSFEKLFKFKNVYAYEDMNSVNPSISSFFKENIVNPDGSTEIARLSFINGQKENVFIVIKPLYRSDLDDFYKNIYMKVSYGSSVKVLNYSPQGYSAKFRKDHNKKSNLTISLIRPNDLSQDRFKDLKSIKSIKIYEY